MAPFYQVHSGLAAVHPKHVVTHGFSCAEVVGTCRAADVCHSDVITVCRWSALRRAHQVDNALQIVDRPELHNDLAFAFAKADRDAGIESRRESLSNVL